VKHLKKERLTDDFHEFEVFGAVAEEGEGFAGRLHGVGVGGGAGRRVLFAHQVGHDGQHEYENDGHPDADRHVQSQANLLLFQFGGARHCKSNS